MTTRKRLAISCLATALLGGVVFFLLASSEPVYRGKRLSRWIRGLEYENINPSDEQRDALRAMGEPAIRRLIAILERRDSAIKRRFVRYAEQHPQIHNFILAPRRVIAEEVYLAQAATALGEIGSAAQAAIPALTVASTNSHPLVAARARAALIKIRQEQITPLLVLLEDTRSTNWLAAAMTVRHLGTNGAAAVPLLVSALQSTNLAVRDYALMALGGVASGPEIAVPALNECLRDKDAHIRRNAIDAIGRFKGAKQQIVPLLLSHLQESDNNAWPGAAFGLEQLLDQNEKQTLYVPALLDSLTNRDQTIRANAAMFLKRNNRKAEQIAEEAGR